MSITERENRLHYWRGSKKFWASLAFIVGLVSGVFSIATYVETTLEQKVFPRFSPWIEIDCPPYKIPSHMCVLSGRFSAPEHDYKVRIYVWPDDNTNRYWLQNRKLDYSYRGKWAEFGIFGNPKRIDHKKIDPTFYAYAVLVDAAMADDLPITNPGCPWLKADGENNFLSKLKAFKGFRAVSEPCRINRAGGNCPDITISSPAFGEIISAPIIPTWLPNYKMYMEIYNGGCLVHSGYHENNTELTLSEDIIATKQTPFYQIIISEAEGNECQAVSWFRLGN
jgi:hypothetical protein